MKSKFKILNVVKK